MTDPLAPRKTERRHRSRTGIGVFVTDAELIEHWGVPEDLGRRIIAEFDRLHRDFPKKQNVFGNRRHLPSVDEWVMRRFGIDSVPQITKERRYG